jgi:hypothetical protein
VGKAHSKAALNKVKVQFVTWRSFVLSLSISLEVNGACFPHPSLKRFVFEQAEGYLATAHKDEFLPHNTVFWSA